MPSTVIAIDVTDLDQSVAFYARALGLSVRAVERKGMIFESRLLAGPRFPGMGIHIRKQFGIRVSGSHPGTLLRISLYTPDVAAWRATQAKPGLRWVGPEPAPDAPHVLFVDPDGYEIEVFSTRGTLIVPPPPLPPTGG